VLAAGLICSVTATASFKMSGRASVIDGDTIGIHGARIRLWGIDAPEAAQLCRGNDSLPYRCGAKAANDLGDFLASHTVVCTTVSLDQYGRSVAVCEVRSIDLGEWLVSNGLALDWRRFSQGRYARTEHEAKSAERGIWSGSFATPWQYRACMRMHGTPSRCSDWPD
jgi:endonuclease YncB( thermonuclease family)